MTAYPDHLTAGLAREHVADLLRAAQAAQLRTDLPRRHRLTRYRPAWWVRVTASGARPVAA